MTQPQDQPQDRLGLVHDNQALRRANEHMARQIRAFISEPGRETLERVDTLLRRAGLINRPTVDAVRDLVRQRDEAQESLRSMKEVQEVLDWLTLLDEPEGREYRQRVTLNDIIDKARKLKEMLAP